MYYGELENREYELYRYVPPHRVGFLHRFGLKTGIHFCGPFWFGIGCGFRGNYGSAKRYLSFCLQMSKKEREICEFEMDFRIFLFAL